MSYADTLATDASLIAKTIKDEIETRYGHAPDFNVKRRPMSARGSFGVSAAIIPLSNPAAPKDWDMSSIVGAVQEKAEPLAKNRARLLPSQSGVFLVEPVIKPS